MEKFNLERALKGEPVKLRNGKKAFVICELPKDRKSEDVELLGYVVDIYGAFDHHLGWARFGRHQKFITSDLDIIGMWVDPPLFHLHPYF